MGSVVFDRVWQMRVSLWNQCPSAGATLVFVTAGHYTGFLTAEEFRTIREDCLAGVDIR